MKYGKGLNMDYREIKMRREKLNLTQIDVCRAVGVSLAAYRNWEMGAGQPKPENLIKLRAVLGAK